MQTEPCEPCEHATADRNGHEDIEHQYFRMSDWLRPDEELDLTLACIESFEQGFCAATLDSCRIPLLRKVELSEALQVPGEKSYGLVNSIRFHLQALQSAVQPMGTEDRIVLLHCDQARITTLLKVVFD